MKKYVSFRTLARQTHVAQTTLFRRIRELEIAPDAITVEVGGRSSTLLFCVERLPDLRRLLSEK